MVSVLVDNDGFERDMHDEAHGHFRFRPARRRGPRARAAGQVRNLRVHLHLTFIRRELLCELNWNREKWMQSPFMNYTIYSCECAHLIPFTKRQVHSIVHT